MKPSVTRRKRGFTLIEVLLVLVILVILASLVVVNIFPILKSAKIKEAKINVEALAVGMDHYLLDIGSYPSNSAGLQALRSQPTDIQDPIKWTGPYLTKDISSDPWNNPYQYACPGIHNPNRFDVWAVTPDGQVIGNWTEETRR